MESERLSDGHSGRRGFRRGDTGFSPAAARDHAWVALRRAVRRPLLAPVLTALALVTVAPAEARIRLFSYDPANAETRDAAGPLTFEFSQVLVSTKLLTVRATEAEATAALKPASASALGAGGLTRLIGANAPQRDLYEVSSADQGGAMIAAFCPGSRRAWMAFERLRVDRDMRVYVLGDAPAEAPP